MFALIRWVVSLIVLAMWCALIGTGLYIAMHEAPEETPAAAVIIVLGGGVSEDGILSANSTARVEHAVALFEAEAAPLMIFTGGGSVGAPEAQVMAESAIAANVPAVSTLTEPNSFSTLQNALFTADLDQIDKTAPVILVSQRFHLPRAWASFRWAGFQDVTLSAADAGAGFSISQNLLMEAIKWPLNVARGAAASIAMAFDVPRDSWIAYLE